MSKLKKQPVSLTSAIADFLFDAAQMLPLPLESPYAHLRRVRNLGPGDISHAFWNLKQSGVADIFEKNNQKFIKLTGKGQLKTLLRKATAKRTAKWDGKWRLIMFDIPERSRKKRNHLRQLLKDGGFVKLQASVFISPYALNREAITYLRQTGLSEFIRILRIDEMDDDKSLRKKFGLSR